MRQTEMNQCADDAAAGEREGGFYPLARRLAGLAAAILILGCSAGFLHAETSGEKDVLALDDASMNSVLDEMIGKMAAEQAPAPVHRESKPEEKKAAAPKSSLSEIGASAAPFSGSPEPDAFSAGDKSAGGAVTAAGDFTEAASQAPAPSPLNQESTPVEIQAEAKSEKSEPAQTAPKAVMPAQSPMAEARSEEAVPVQAETADISADAAVPAKAASGEGMPQAGDSLPEAAPSQASFPDGDASAPGALETTRTEKSVQSSRIFKKNKRQRESQSISEKSSSESDVGELGAESASAAPESAETASENPGSAAAPLARTSMSAPASSEVLEVQPKELPEAASTLKRPEAAPPIEAAETIENHSVPITREQDDQLLMTVGDTVYFPQPGGRTLQPAEMLYIYKAVRKRLRENQPESLWYEKVGRVKITELNQQFIVARILAASDIIRQGDRIYINP